MDRPAPIDALTRHLEALGTTQLAELLRRRPDLATPELQRQSLPAWQRLQAALALGDEPTTTDLVTFLDDGPGAHARPDDEQAAPA